jgi:hypothetical protein
MSAEEDKIKRSMRLHKEEAAIAKQVKIAKAYGMNIKETHKLAKHHALDCGQPGCVNCGNPRKIFKEKTVQEKRFEQTEGWDD